MNFLQRRSDDQGFASWVSALDEPAALFSFSGRLVAANAGWSFGAGPRVTGLTALDAALAGFGDPAAAFRLAKAARRGEAACETVGGVRVRADRVEGGILVRATPAASAAPAADDAASGQSQPPAPAPVGPATPAPPAGMSGRAGLADLINAAPVGVARLDGADARAARILDANLAFFRIAGGEAGVSLSSLVPPGEVADLARLQIGATEPVQLSLSVEEGRAAEGWLMADGENGAALVIVDVTMRREMEQRLAQGGKMQALGGISAKVAHELNNWLQVVYLHTDNLLTRHPVGDPIYNELQQIKENTVRSADLVRNLLAYSRKQTLRREVMDVGAVLSEFAVLIRQVLDERVRFDIVHGRDLPQVRADKQQLETVLMNLVTNARDAVLSTARPGGEVIVRTRAATSADVREALAGVGVAEVPEATWAMIAVSDTGTGMPPEVAAKIFEPFFTTKDTGKGTGIGMASVYGIVKQSGGFITLETEEGVGTTFRVFLPAAAPEEAAAAEAAKATAPEARPRDLAGKGRILLVEDDKGVRAITALLLTQRGYQVVEACDGEEALEILEDAPASFDLVLSDVMMPGMDGPTMLKAARPHLGHARIVFMSGYAERDFAQTLEDERAISFLPKPFNLQDLAERVKSELAS
jgi:two-component system cell cycle sensor histidine kinase/response regulator CckA